MQQHLSVANLQLKPGAATETDRSNVLTVPVLQSQDASVGQVVDSKTLNDLPLNGRNFTFLAQSVAGVNTPQADTRGNAATGAFAANGNRPAQNNYLLDGIDNNSDTVDFLNGTNFVVLPPVDAIQEFKVQTSGFSAQYGRSGAAVLNATIKSGTNDFMERFGSSSATTFWTQRIGSRMRRELKRELTVKINLAWLPVARSSRTKYFSSPTTRACDAGREQF